MDNPLLDLQDLPPFSRIRPEQVEPAIDQLLTEARQAIEVLLAANETYSWDNLVRPLEDIEDRLNRAWSPVGHLNAVMNSDALRAAYNACLPKLSAYGTELGQHEGLFRAYRQIAEGEEYTRLDAAQRRVIDNALRDFRLSGIELEPAQRERYKVIQQELSALQSKFSENLLDATQAWTRQ
ncbi:MAG TPA: oligopeptidase A, partial [Gammaproteobacteria bacterium]